MQAKSVLPPKSTDFPRSIRISPSEAALIQEAANALGMSRHAFMRETILKRAAAVVGEGE